MINNVQSGNGPDPHAKDSRPRACQLTDLLFLFWKHGNLTMAAKRSRATFEADQNLQPYTFYGTPLPPLDSDARDDGSYTPIWNQEVRDERGRRRLHGAFTGGFSAGYFNTVGSKEGWTPAQFVSSRENRARDAKHAPQRPEDFMDEEDIKDREERQKISTSDDFAGFGSTEADATRRAGLLDLLKIGGETMGMKLLKKMGWREGQGIGPKVRRRANLEDGTLGEETHLFAPANPPLVAFVRKKDFKGLGFEGEARLERPSESENDEKEDSDSFYGERLAATKPKPKKKLGGFGVGILNDTGSDDEDPYSLGPQISYNRRIGGDKKKPKKVAKPPTVSANPLIGPRPVYISKKAAAARSAGSLRKSQDGRLPLDGFILADRLSDLSVSEKIYEPPKIPEGWQSAKKPPSSSHAEYVSTADAAKASSLDPNSRAALLGEAQLPGKSVFDWMTPEARERLVKLTGNTNLPPAMSEKAPKGYELSEADRQKDIWDLVPKLDKKLAAQALARAVSGWMPYQEDEKKRERYRKFLEVRAGLRHTLPDRVPGSSTDDWVLEMTEFSRAAEVFKPMTGAMASRFTSASSGPKIASDAPDSDPLTRPAEKPDSPAVAAAKIGMFGQMTRSTHDFYPARLLCKRFNVRPPDHVQFDPGDQPSGPGAGKGPRFQSGGYQTPSAPRELVSQEVMNLILEESGRQPMAAPGPDRPGAQTRPAAPLEPERNEALEAERPDDSLFKEIFGSDDEDE
ncbi:hypothetical protein N7468_002199 [Penicillium chermesinum]|uniref:G-patch domain-containing protein n=1 Tax=Penicillium chermesinum TaxID=63820 RepID=A0A9W9PI25_9EURO|nr:uncharacterized protein N7468_002199 [Penicillium chermesinum]KAJ5247216.1 hypothetical protein N7468_002199 [Penicillium chermesinum]